ncbi:TPA: helix-turn-helix domain-containing protein [Legionella pneumophila]|nr:helix-turn-helix domain-containing protein [Legionella pneumophila]
MNTFNIEEAAEFLGAHRETIRRLAASGELPAVKIGRGWIFLEQDLVMYIRNKYSTCDASQGVNRRSIDIWHSTKEMGSGGQTFSTKESAYAKALGRR